MTDNDISYEAMRKRKRKKYEKRLKERGVKL